MRKLTRVIAVSICFIVLVGCSSSALMTHDVPQFPEPGDGKGMVFFYRPSAFTGAAISYDVFSGTQKIGGVKNGTYFYTEVDPGMHEFWAKTEAKKNIIIAVDANKKYYVKCGVGFGLFVGRPKFEIVHEVTGSNEILNTKLATLK